MPKLNQAYAQRLIMDENTQYLILAFIWLTSKPVTGICFFAEKYYNRI